MSAFEDNPHFNQPKLIHRCCDVWAHICLCSDRAQAQVAISPAELEALLKKIQLMIHLLC